MSVVSARRAGWHWTIKGLEVISYRAQIAQDGKALTTAALLMPLISFGMTLKTLIITLSTYIQRVRSQAVNQPSPAMLNSQHLQTMHGILNMYKKKS